MQLLITQLMDYTERIFTLCSLRHEFQKHIMTLSENQITIEVKGKDEWDQIIDLIYLMNKQAAIAHIVIEDFSHQAYLINKDGETWTQLTITFHAFDKLRKRRIMELT